MDLLCHSLQIHDEDVQRKIWTTFEYTIMKHPDLMKDRHLDQLLMCSLYIVCKVVGQDRNFTDVMRQYKTQPQAASHVYRSVLLGPKSDSAATDKKEGKSDQSKPPPTPTKPANASTIADGEERGDLIKFYNDVFMHRLQEFGLKFKRSRQAEAPPLSPLPKLRSECEPAWSLEMSVLSMLWLCQYSVSLCFKKNCLVRLPDFRWFSRL